jgi:hypothetical protein
MTTSSQTQSSRLAANLLGGAFVALIALSSYAATVTIIRSRIERLLRAYQLR